MSKLVIGIDFDNTIVNYDDAVYEAALDCGLIDRSVDRNKKHVRDAVRKIPDGEDRWQELQAYLYTEGMRKAKLMNGVTDMFRKCREEKIDVYVISHKTEYASKDTAKINLRETALDWMYRNDFFHGGDIGLEPRKIFFESTRQEKVRRIENLACTHFIDDLEETFLEKNFPENVQKILYQNEYHNKALTDAVVAPDWGYIYDYFFGR